MEFIKKYKILDRKKELLAYYQENYSFDENLMFFLLGINLENFENLYSLIEKLNNTKNLIIFDSSLYSILKKILFQKLNLKEDLEIIEIVFKNYNAEDWNYILFQSLILSSYSLNDYEILNSYSELNGYYGFFSNQIKFINFENINTLCYIEKIDMLIKNNYKNLDVYNKEFKLTEYLANITGILNFELQFLVKNYIDRLDKNLCIDLKIDFLNIKKANN